MDRTKAQASIAGPHPRDTRPSRRQFLQGGAALTGLGLLAGCGTLPSLGLGRKTPRIGAVHVDNGIVLDWMKVWKDRLAELGHVDAQSVVIEWREAKNHDDFEPLVADLLNQKVDIIMAAGWYAMNAAK